MLYSSRLLFLSLFGLYILSTAAGISSDQHDIIIELHKKLRENHKKTVGLKWDALLAFQSKQYVKKCDYNSAKDSSKISELLAVDNVASGYKDWYQTINAWYRDNKYYDYDYPGYTDATATFITMVWKDTERVGCASQDCPGGVLYHCLYSPSISIHLILDEKEYESNVGQNKS